MLQFLRKEATGMAGIHRPGQEVQETPTHILRLPLILESHQQKELDKVFEASRLLYNSMVRFFLRQYELYKQSKQYKLSTAILEDKNSTKAQKFRARKVLADM